MNAVHLFDLASQQAQWLSVRQTAVANNIANANTPGYRPVDVDPFEKVLDRSLMTQAATHQAHFRTGGAGLTLTPTDAGSMNTNSASSSVKLEEELVKSGEVAHAYELNTAIVKAFHKFFLMTVKS